MTTVTLLPSGKTIDVEPGTVLIEAVRRADIEIDSPCGAKGTCGRCIARITRGEVDSRSLGILPGAAVADGYVLACKTHVLDTPIEVDVPEPLGREGGKISEEDETYLIRRELLPRGWEYNPLAVKWLIQTPAPQPEDGLSDLDRLTRSVQQQWGPKSVVFPLRVMRSLAEVLRRHNGLVTVTLVHADSKLHVVRVEPGDVTTHNYAIAVDIGTTTVSVQLVSLTLATILATRSAYNGQIACGVDVISRINYARKPGGLEELRTRVLKTVNELLEQVTRSRNLVPEDITNAVVSANTTMTHLLLGIDPEYIRLDPYTPTVLEVPYLVASEVGIDINPDSWVCFSPNNGSYVGGDITAGLLCTDIATDSDEVNLFIDIGTNGELVVGCRDFLMSCACSAGPAFEGGGVECGMRAAIGAIERIDVDPETGQPDYSTIGNVPPKGICGSGMIDLLANLFTTGWVDPSGKLDRQRPCPHIRFEGKRATYLIATADESGSGAPIYISELDIENIIRAKAAIYSACALMLGRIGIRFDDLSHIYIAGGFGRYLDLEKAVTIGLAPDVARDKFRFIGNAALMGSYMVVVSQENRNRQLELARRMTYMDLSNDPGYMDAYMAAMFLPHTDSAQFPSVARHCYALA